MVWPSYDDIALDLAAFTILVGLTGGAAQLALGLSAHDVELVEHSGSFLAIFAGIVVGLPFLPPHAIAVEAGKRLSAQRSTHLSQEGNRRHNAHREAQRPLTLSLVQLERYYAFAMAVLGTVLNTYGSWLVRHF